MDSLATCFHLLDHRVARAANGLSVPLILAIVALMIFKP